MMQGSQKWLGFRLMPKTAQRAPSYTWCCSQRPSMHQHQAPGCPSTTLGLGCLASCERRSRRSAARRRRSSCSGWRARFGISAAHGDRASGGRLQASVAPVHPTLAEGSKRARYGDQFDPFTRIVSVCSGGYQKSLVGAEGFEPSTNELRAACCELRFNCRRCRGGCGTAPWSWSALLTAR